MNKQKGLAPIVIVLLIALGIGGYLLYQNQAKSTTTPSQQTAQPSPATSDETVYTESDQSANWKTYTDSWVTFKYPSNLFAKSGASQGDEHIVTLVTDQNTSYINGELSINSSLRDDLSNYDKALKSYKDRLSNLQIKEINDGVVLSGTISNQMVSNLEVKYALLKYKSGVLLVKNEKFTPTVSDQVFDQILSTFKFVE